MLLLKGASYCRTTRNVDRIKLLHMLLIRVYPFVFIDHIGNKVILYNSMASSFHIYEIEDGICVLNKSTFSMKSTLANGKVAREIKRCNLGLDDEVSSLHNFYLSDISTEVSDRLEELCNKRIYDAKKMIKRLIISLSPSLDVFSGMNQALHRAKSQIADAEVFQSFTRLISLACVFFYIDKNVVAIFSKVYAEILLNYYVEVATPLQDYQYIASDMSELGINKVILLVHEVTKDSLHMMSQFMLDKNVMSFWVYISSMEDYVKLQNAGMLLNKKVLIKCNPFGNLGNLKTLLSYSVDDILSTKNSKNNCIRNDWINLNFWGDLFVNALGDVLIAGSNVIGNIYNWNNIQFGKLLSEESLWRMVRRDKDKCKTCLFRNICPPISLIEKKFNSTFCNL